MLVLEVITWWYGTGWKELILRLQNLVSRVLVVFSVPLLIRTLFSPWRRIITFTDNSFMQNIRAALDNAVSRFVGFWVRLIVIFTALSFIIFIIISGIIAVILWPLLPVLGVLAVLRGLLP